MSAQRKSWAVLFVALAWVTASSGCGSSPGDAPVGSGGAAPADGAIERRPGDASASVDVSADVVIVENDAPGDAGEASVALDAAEASVALDATTNPVDAAPDGDTGDAGSTVEAGGTDDAGDAQSDDGAQGTDGSSGDAAMGDAPLGDAGTDDPTFLCDGPGSRYVTDVVSFNFGPGQNFGQTAFPANIFGPPKGAVSGLGSLDVVSLGSGGSVTMAFAGNAIVDGPGADFIVFENAFDVANDPMNPFAELGIVEVSQDGVQWYAFPCTATQYPYGTCAGWHPVFANPDQNTIDPTDPATAGGDPFDLADLGLTWARYVRVTDRPDDSNVFDLDAVAIVHPRCP